MDELSKIRYHKNKPVKSLTQYELFLELRFFQDNPSNEIIARNEWQTGVGSDFQKLRKDKSLSSQEMMRRQEPRFHKTWWLNSG